MQVKNTNWCTVKQSFLFNLRNDLEAESIRFRKETRDRFQTRQDYSWCKIKRKVSNIIQW